MPRVEFAFLDDVPLESDAAYTCPACFESNFIGVDPTAGQRQQLIEDCPVCCRALIFNIAFDAAGDALVQSVEREA